MAYMPYLTENRKAHFDYEILEIFEAGLALKGFEAKSVRLGRSRIQGAYIIIRNNEAVIIGMHIPPYQQANTPEGYDPDRTRTILLHKKEIQYLQGKSQEKGLTLVPLKVYTKRNLIKLEFGIARGKRSTDKRQTIQKREENRHMERILKDMS